VVSCEVYRNGIISKEDPVFPKILPNMLPSIVTNSSRVLLEARTFRATSFDDDDRDTTPLRTWKLHSTSIVALSVGWSLPRM